ncbi:ubiquitin carboxyl-terminal hydrolase 16 isoform X1 [Amia ocellicauda]|uniref:ubiquitin carboxyl-terminal hydrolase 16 isoform X1 n=1 Tax=Amia ocellicauda TaxID=2972642 RepID=UPI003464E4AF
MGKKRAKEKHQKDEDSFDLTVPRCTHIRKGIEQHLHKKIAQGVHWYACQECKDEETLEATSEEENGERPMIWICLKCGHRGCGRNSENQHAIKHYEKPRSEPHCLVLSLDNWIVWCYSCDDEVQYSSTGQLAQLVTFIRKQALPEISKKTPNKTAAADEQEHEPREDKKPEEIKKEQKKHAKEDMTEAKEEKTPDKTNSTTVSVKGLSNLGNTCFFNAVVQNLFQTQPLRQLLSEMKAEKTTVTITPEASTGLEPLLITLNSPGSLTLAMCQLLNEIQETKKGVVTPKELFSQVCKKAARFKGFQQQDSQELLRYLLDGMKAEEMKRVNSGILEALNHCGNHTEAEELKKLVKEYEKSGAHLNFVDQVFGGELTSTVMCKECRTVSLVTEMFLDLSLPVSDEAYRKKNQKKNVRKISENEDDDYKMPTASANGKEDLPSGAGSKYQQKKVKKQAKKQAKIQRRQQKQGGKMELGSTAQLESEELPNGVESSSQGEVSQADPGDSAQGEPCSDSSEQAQTDNPEPSNEENSAKDCQDNHNGSGGNEPKPTEDETGQGDADVLPNGDNRCGTLTNESAREGEIVQDLHNLRLNDAFISPDDIDLEIDVSEAAADTKAYVVVNQDPDLAFSTLAVRAAPGKQECSVQSCLFQFTEVEHLTKNNSLQCVTCTRQKGKGAKSSSDGDKNSVYTDALKQMLISRPPPVLTLHLKRFQQVGYGVCKVNRHVQFPQVLDLAPFCTVNCKNIAEGETRMLYSLYGIVEHSGTMRSGHYTAYVKVQPKDYLSKHLNGLSPQVNDAELVKGSWFHISDTSVQAVPETKVQNSQAYLLFYERIL